MNTKRKGLKVMDGGKKNVNYAPDKPSDCRNCFLWQSNKKGCKVGKDNCYYLIPDNNTSMQKKDSCMGCPYGRVNPCIGFCMKKIMRKPGMEL